MHQIQIQCVYFLKEKLWCRDCTARQRPVPVTSIPIPPGPCTCCLCTVQYCTVHTVLYRGEMSGQCQLSVRPLCSGYHCRWHMDELLISSCNHNLVFFNLYDDIHQIQYSAQYTTALFILERSGVRIFLNFLFVLSPPPILLLVSSIPSSSQNYVQTQLDISLDVDVTA